MTINTQGPPQTQINSIIALYSDGQIQEALDSVETLIGSGARNGARTRDNRNHNPGSTNCKNTCVNFDL